nr:hypothetical protein [Oceanococcus sp. HetDA_MAG_MS8]
MRSPAPITTRRAAAQLTAIACMACICPTAVLAGAWYTEAELSIQTRIHPEDGPRSEQEHTDNSLGVLAEFYWESDDRNHSFTFTPWARQAVEAESRSHWDIRELQWTGVFGDWELRAGISKVYWGRTEIFPLVDVINQLNLLENFDGEDRLGQPMLRAAYRTGPGYLIGFVLPGFREQRFPGQEARLSPPLAVRDSDPVYESTDEDSHVDWAVRYAGYVGSLDFGIAHFQGTNRQPLLIPDNPMMPTALVPAYGQMEQTSIDAQYTAGGWLYKLEALYRDSGVPQFPADGLQWGDEQFYAATGGLEYTSYGIASTSADLGMVVEYLWDERGEAANTAFQNDLFLGGRLAFNDVLGTAILSGVVVDLDNDTRFFNLEASGRFNGQTSWSLQTRVFSNVSAEDQLFSAIQNDDYLELNITRYF